MVMPAKDKVILEKGNWVASHHDQGSAKFAVSRINQPTNKLVGVAFPRIDLIYENDAKELVNLLAKFEKLATLSLRQIAKSTKGQRDKLDKATLQARLDSGV